MQTARRAAASIADARHHGVPALDLIDNGGGGRCAVVCLGAPHHVGDAQLLAQQAFQVGEVALGAFLAIGDEAHRLALERSGPRRRLAAGGSHFMGGVEHPQRHGSILWSLTGSYSTKPAASVSPSLARNQRRRRWRPSPLSSWCRAKAAR